MCFTKALWVGWKGPFLMHNQLQMSSHHVIILKTLSTANLIHDIWPKKLCPQRFQIPPYG